MIKTRIAPSPTGALHIGTARTALFNFLFARQNGGEFLLRIEDTDQARSKKEFEEDIIENLKWLGLTWNGETARQSEREDIYARHISELKEKNLVREEKAREGNGRALVLKKPAGDVSFHDLIRGEVTFAESELTDLVIQKPDGTPTYNFAVAVDDHETGVTHVIRGEDHISNTPKQLMVYSALGWEPPKFAHLPLILAPDRSKLSKRHGAVEIGELRKEGYLPKAVVNFLSLLGWHPKDEQEIFTTDELVTSFRLEDVQKGGAVFDKAKLDWINQQHIQRLSYEEYKKRLGEFAGGAVSNVFARMTQQRAKTLSEATEELRWLKTPEYRADLLPWKETSAGQTKKNLEAARSVLENLPEEKFTHPELENALVELTEARGRGEVLWPLRAALSGAEKSPGPFELATLIGKEETLRRLRDAVEKIAL